MALLLSHFGKLPQWLITKIWKKVKAVSYKLWKSRDWLNYEDVHLLWILFWSALNTIAFAAPGNMSFDKAMVFGVSTATVTGLNPQDMSTLFLGQQIWTYIAVRATSTPGIAVFTHLKRVRDLRKYKKEYFELKEKIERESRSSSGSGTPPDNPAAPAVAQGLESPPAQDAEDLALGEAPGAIPLTPIPTSPPVVQTPINVLTFRDARYLKQRIEAKEFGDEGQLASNGQFEGLNPLGRLYVLLLEYLSQKFNVGLIMIYTLTIEVIGIIAYIILIRQMTFSEALDNGTNISWAGAYHSASATFNFGLVLLDTGMPAFRRIIPFLIISTFQQLAGNMMFGPFLRWITRLC
ncbi:hypothetical protein CLAFUW4_02775 [Fulvia fulva]|uniref:Uncharacterized protein n=1 Tax=Passalora fulva TaxID=5499 RepID=A0A9Q8LBS5_PASFU|nr:uncharacterized protein CLAFUR5_02762 [Fulvia fulva]KAK4632367.1 hypothetical protein CLAFUR4_02769 [Fulvia fulva]KAK4633904.1 hypothetical protein CLAFUR0_02771 [Fulvia fulva]UJO14586.1 hypothetical protein CLAFUR5_02762 [Fulvia fulva]WPV11392.1 hypothetical protein CLAFUW4_02775 [Fulvia fulva]WPV26836.1 hypothetical protein CLAFUW7_02773 [Fulvia fulva]